VFKAHSGAGPLLGIATETFSSNSSVSVAASVSFDAERNLFFKVTGKSYHLLELSVELTS
jgi:hypothetical protein